MADKQSNDSFVNAQEKMEWVEAEKPVIPVQPSVEAAQPPVTRPPVYVFAQDTLHALAERRRSKARLTVLRFFSQLVAAISVWNVLCLFSAPDSEMTTADFAFIVLKVIIGICGTVVLGTKKFAFIKTYALVWFVIYASWFTYYVHRANTYWYFWISDQCSRNQHIGFEPYTECMHRKWWLVKQEALLYLVYTFLGFSITFRYALMAEKFWEPENLIRNEHSNVDVV